MGKNEFNTYQKREIRLGKESGIEYELYMDKSIPSLIMRECRIALESGVDITPYVKGKNFDNYQAQEIRYGLMSHIDVSIYAREIYTALQMAEIRKGLEMDVNVKLYSNPKYNNKQMREIRVGLVQNLDTSFYSSFNIPSNIMAEIRRKLIRLVSEYSR